MMDFEKLAKEVEKLEQAAAEVTRAANKKERPPDALDPATVEPTRAAMKSFVVTLRDVLTIFLKDRKEPIRPGHLFKDAAAKSIVPGEAAPRGDALIVRWGGHVTPTDGRTVYEDALKLADLASKILPILKAYRKEKETGDRS